MLARIFGLYIVALNSIPRIALVPLIILMFGLGDMSKIATAWIVVFFVVFFNTFEGTRAVDRDQIAAARLLGGVIVGEFIGAERGLGKLIIEAEARANASEMMVAILVMMVVGMLLAFMVRSLQSYLLRWQQQSDTQV